MKFPRPKKFLTVFFSVMLIFFVSFCAADYFFPFHPDIPYSVVVSDEKGNVLHAFLSKDEKWRFKTELDEITPDLQNAIVFKEDKYFFWHFGVNPFAILRAAANNLFSGRRTSGASTITMQVVRLSEPGERTYARKLYEMFRAVQLEWHYSKREILQMYLNLVPYGGNIEGVKTASWLFFGKMPQKLSLAQITTLSIVPNRPTSLALGKKNDFLEREQKRWLGKFAEIFPEKVIRDALQEPLQIREWSVKKHLKPAIPHLANRLKRENPDKINIVCNISIEKQWQTEKILTAYMENLRRYDINNAAVYVIDNRSNKVVVYIGSNDFEDKVYSGEVDGITANRSPGSTLKPMVYALGIERGFITPKMHILDTHIDIDGYAPDNFDQKFHGSIPADVALPFSLNVPAVKVLGEAGLNNALLVLKKCNFKHISKNEKNLGLSLALGGCGVTLEEMTNLYAVFARRGTYQKAKLLADETNSEHEKIFRAETAFLIAEMLTKTERPDLPSDYHNSRNVPKIAWKTGTSYGRRDAWSIGFNGHYTIGVWVGNFSGNPVYQITGAQAATPLLFRIFTALDYAPENEWLRKPQGLDERQVCSESGLPPAEFCTNLVTDYFIPLVSTTQTCEHLKIFFVSEDEKKTFCSACLPAKGFSKKLYPNLPPDLVAYYEEYGHPYRKLPPHNPECNAAFEDGLAPKIASPVNNRTYFLDGNNVQLQLVAKAFNSRQKVHWFINDKHFKTCDVSEKPFFAPPLGEVKISCTDEQGRTSKIKIKVQRF
jgi:penicillin-binding protein 1C